VQAQGRAAEVSLLRHGNEVAQVPQLEIHIANISLRSM
jgi:hypothetical protein